MIKRLADAIVHGFGFSAGKALFEEAAEKVEAATREPTPKEREAAEKEAKKRALAEEKARAAAAKQAEKDRKKAAAEIDAELEALKKKVGRK